MRLFIAAGERWVLGGNRTIVMLDWVGGLIPSHVRVSTKLC